MDEGRLSVRRLDGGELGAEVLGERRVERLGVSLLALISLSDLGASESLANRFHAEMVEEEARFTVSKKSS